MESEKALGKIYPKKPSSAYGCSSGSAALDQKEGGNMEEKMKRQVLGRGADNSVHRKQPSCLEAPHQALALAVLLICVDGDGAQVSGSHRDMLIKPGTLMIRTVC